MANTLFVGGVGPGNYTIIQDAIDASNNGDTVYVYSGTYNENLAISSNVILIGETKDTTMIEGSGSGIGVFVSASWVQIKGFTITNFAYGIRLSYAQRCYVSDNIMVSNSWVGIHLEYSDNNSIADNSLLGNIAGAILDYSHNNTLTDNTIDSNSVDGIGILSSDNNQFNYNIISANGNALYFHSSSSNTITNNTVSSNGRSGVVFRKSTYLTFMDNNLTSDGITFSGNILPYYNTHTIQDNMVNDKPLYYLKDCNDVSIDGIPVGQLIIVNCTNVEVSNLHISDADVSMNLAYLNGATIRGNDVSLSAWYGIRIRYSSNVDLLGNNVSNNVNGVRYWYLTNGEFIGNTVVDNGRGLSLLLSTQIDINRNAFHDHSGEGIFVWDSSEISVYNNNVVNNGIRASDNTLNSWNASYPTGGNYWSDYPGFDSMSGPNQDIPGSDGIGDTFYNVPGGPSVDEYPLMNPVSIPTTPFQPQNLQASGGDRQVALTWNPPASDGGFAVTNYRIHRETASGGETFSVEIGDVLTYTDTGLTNGKTYYYVISAINFLGEGAESQEVSATPGTTPGSPNNVTASATNSQVLLSWSPPLDDGGFPVMNYSIHRGTSPDGETLLTTVGNVLNYMDTGLTNGVTYFYTVAAVNALGEGPPSNETGDTPENQSPNCTITAPATGASVMGVMWITGKAADSDGFVQNVEVRIDSSGWLEANGNESWSLNWDTTNLSNGEHTLFARSFDGENYSIEATVHLNVNNPTPDEAESDTIWIVVSIAVAVIVAAGVTIAFLIRKRRGK
ncbi:MAG: right-handed parallel beta-helix repeat-containing protein, partial [Thermoplasmata archaeon]|nr:right-handed parallel beta-helix repeat-containing protein [Thermoplasmata archaeon]